MYELEYKLLTDARNSDNYDLKDTFAYNNNTIMLLEKFQKRDLTKALRFTMLSLAQQTGEICYFIMLLVSSLDLKVQKGRADCLQLPETVIHCFQIHLARIQSKHLQEFSTEPCIH